MKKHLRLATAAFAATSLLLAGCGDDNGVDPIDDDGVDVVDDGVDDGIDDGDDDEGDA